METGKIKGISKFSIALGFFGQALLTGLVAGYVTYFGTDIVGISALAMGNILLVSRIFDGAGFFSADFFFRKKEYVYTILIQIL